MCLVRAGLVLLKDLLEIISLAPKTLIVDHSFYWPLGMSMEAQEATMGCTFGGMSTICVLNNVMSLLDGIAPMVSWRIWACQRILLTTA